MKATVPVQRRLIVGISGASGVVYGLRVLQLLRNSGVETHLVMSKTAELTFAYETTVKIAEVKAAAHTYMTSTTWPPRSRAARFARRG